ncbi:MAG: hypothetical protein A3B44_04300 [Candidatus Levybacteria bacterium RIFCSPLOWO2_01_FULL_38_21]|nr:MAG: hypothetical protein A3B44_04300 [Candidatus Levybacteria bacterium RIFCSPLOWO2_01_FULL_38_21]
MKLKTGVAFPDFISTEKIRGGEHHYKKRYQMRGFFIPAILFLAIIGILLRLFYIQILQGSYFRKLSDLNRMKTITIHAPRGVILDRNGKPLVYNTPGFRETINGKTQIIDRNQALFFIAQGKKDLEVDSLRYYPHKEIFSHVLGYIGQISEDDLKEARFADYKGGDLIGKMGLEQEYERILKGIDGKQLVEVDSLGKTVRKLGQTDPTAGSNITVALDLNLQKAVFEATKDVKKGAVIVSTPNGEILAMLSKPSFDPNLFTQGQNYRASSGSYTNIEEVLSDNKNQPLLNRAISGVYPPGSTFKLVVAASALKNKIIDENFEIEDTGSIRVGIFSFSNWYFTQYGKKDGAVNIVKGIKRSNDIFFYKLAEKIGVDKISQTANEFGLGQKLSIDLQGEAKGLVPTTDWKEKITGEPWFLGDTYNYGIGQGYLLTTPLQVNYWTQIIANGGNGYKPHLRKIQSAKSADQISNLFTEESVSLIRQGMIESCSPGGVAWPLFKLKIPAKGWSASGGKNVIDGKNFIEENSSGSAKMVEVTIACKTGTAQHGGENTMPHAWITLFAPAYDPQIVVTVLSEESGEGSNVAAPIAKKILEEYFKNR